MDRITGFLNGKSVLLTGATGFLGQPVVEKILWAAPDVKRIHVLIRPKRQFGGDVQTPRERLEKELFTSSVFDRLRFRHGESFEAFLDEKLVAVAGDISEAGLGIDPDVRAELVRDLDVVINSAAVVSFDAPLDQALELNVLGAGRVAGLAAECERAVLIHVSTAYVCGTIEGIVPETLHHAAPDATEPFPERQIVDPEREIETIRTLIDEVRAEGESARVRRELVAALVERRNRRGADRREPRRETIEKLKHQWMDNRLVEAGMEWARSRGWNDTYTYTKALGEQIVLRRRGETPAAIVRPAIIESSLHEPSPGWLDGLRMADPLIAAIGKGRLRSLPLDPELTIDLVPADMVVNAMLAAIPRLAEEGGTPIYQVATGSRNPVTMGELHDLIVRYFQANPMLDKKGEPIQVRSLRFPGARRFRAEYTAKAKPIEWAQSALEALLDRGVASDVAQKQRRRLAATKAALDKLFYYGELYEPYLNLDARFQVDRTMELFQWLTPEERRRFNFDVTRLNWRHYMHVHIAGVKKYILKVERAGTLEVDDEVAAHEASVSTIPDLLERTADRHPEKIALRVQRDGGWHEISYARLRTDVRAVAERLLRMGLTKGDRIVLVSENRPEWGVCYLGAATIGLVVVPLDAQTWHREVWATADYTGARAILASRSVLDGFTDDELAANEAAEEPLWLLGVDDHGRPLDLDGYPRSSRPEVSDAPVHYPDVESSDLASIIFTTGTAVDPKGAMHTHANFLNNLFGVSRYLSADDADEFLSVLPLYHALEFTCGLLMPIYRGATVTYARSIKPKVLIETMRETGTTVMLGVPTLFALIRDDIERRILRAGKSPLRSSLMKTSKRLVRGWERTVGKNIARQLFARVHEELGGRIRFFVSGGSKLGEELYADFKALGLTIYEGYGLTETAPGLTVNPLFQSRAGSAGKPLPGTELRLYHTDREGVGEIIVRTPSLMKGYWDNPAATERVMVDGWFRGPRLGRRRRLPLHHRADQGRHRDRGGQERLPDGSRGDLPRAPRGARDLRGGDPERAHRGRARRDRALRRGGVPGGSAEAGPAGGPRGGPGSAELPSPQADPPVGGAAAARRRGRPRPRRGATRDRAAPQGRPRARTAARRDGRRPPGSRSPGRARPALQDPRAADRARERPVRRPRPRLAAGDRAAAVPRAPLRRQARGRDRRADPHRGRAPRRDASAGRPRGSAHERAVGGNRADPVGPPVGRAQRHGPGADGRLRPERQGALLDVVRPRGSKPREPPGVPAVPRGRQPRQPPRRPGDPVGRPRGARRGRRPGAARARRARSSTRRSRNGSSPPSSTSSPSSVRKARWPACGWSARSSAPASRRSSSRRAPARGRARSRPSSPDWG